MQRPASVNGRALRLPFLLIGYIQLTLVVVVMRHVFGIPIQGSLVSLYFLSGLFIASSASFVTSAADE